MNAAAHSGSFVQLLCRADDMIGAGITGNPTHWRRTRVAWSAWLSKDDHAW